MIFRWTFVLFVCSSPLFAFGQDAHLLATADDEGPGERPAGKKNDAPYYLFLKRELLIGGTGIGSVVLGSHLKDQVPEVRLHELELGTIPFFDRFAVDFNSGAAGKASDRTRDLSSVLPALLLLGKPSRRDAPTLLLLYAETVALRRGLTSIVKYTARRPRPYLRAEGLDGETIVRSGDREAFLSGHTSGTASTAFFFGRVFADYYPDSKLKPYVWGLAIGLPAITGYQRIRAGQHYPSDIIAGYALGAAVGYLVPTLHKRQVLPRGMRSSGGLTGVRLDYRF